jgi:glycosyltransferase involved in cell wall biosynthesis
MRMRRPRWRPRFATSVRWQREESKLLAFLMRPRMPWRLRYLRDRSANRCASYMNRLGHLLYPRQAPPSIVVSCGFHGKSGGVTATASLANMLSNRYGVDFVTNANSNYNTLLQRSVRMIDRPRLHAPVLLCDVASGTRVIRSAQMRQQTVIVTCHALLDSLHGFSPEYISDMLLSADLVHFVNPIQQDSFKLPPGKFFIIPNLTTPIIKCKKTKSVGIVGRLHDPHKNVSLAIDIALRSQADSIHLWGAEENIWACHPRVKVHRWTSDKSKIFNSFDVLIHLSRHETFGMVVIEAMSAGLPCLLSPIPAFEQFRGCPGARLIDERDYEHAPQNLNELLQAKDVLAPYVKAFWRRHFSDEVIAAQWFRLIDSICINPPR